jgi:CRISPR-associated endoribonuclease Cas6
LVSSWLEGGEPESVHTAGTKPFRCGLTSWHPSGTTQLTIGVLDDSLLPRLQRRATASAATIRLGRSFGSLARLGDGALRSESIHADWTDLLDAARVTDTFRFRFISPTVVRSGRTSVPQPAPGTVFGHLRSRWSAFAPPDLQPDIEFASLGLEVEAIDGGTLGYPSRHGVVPGFVGEMVIRCTAGTDRELRVLDALARLTPFAGIGANTTIGMGEARYLDR